MILHKNHSRSLVILPIVIPRITWYTVVTIKERNGTAGQEKNMTTAIVDYKAGKGTISKYIVDRNEYPEIADIMDALMHEDVYKIEVYENGELVTTARNYR